MHENVAGIHLLARPAARWLGLLLLAGLAPACYSSSGKSYMAPPAPGGVGTLFSDGFTTFPGTSWTKSVSPASSADAAFTYVPPFYYLDMTDTARPGSVSALTTMTFASQPLTFVATFQYSAASASIDTVSVQIVDNSVSPVVLAQAVVNANTQMISFTVGGGAATTVAFQPATFETVSFSIDASNMGSWHMGSTTTAPAAFGSHTTALRLLASYGSAATAAPIFRFDTVVVSNP